MLGVCEEGEGVNERLLRTDASTTSVVYWDIGWERGCFVCRLIYGAEEELPETE